MTQSTMPSNWIGQIVQHHPAREPSLRGFQSVINFLYSCDSCILKLQFISKFPHIVNARRTQTQPTRGEMILKPPRAGADQVFGLISYTFQANTDLSQTKPSFSYVG